MTNSIRFSLCFAMWINHCGYAAIDWALSNRTHDVVLTLNVLSPKTYHGNLLWPLILHLSTVRICSSGSSIFTCPFTIFAFMDTISSFNPINYSQLYTLLVNNLCDKFFYKNSYNNSIMVILWRDTYQDTKINGGYYISSTKWDP